VNQLERSNLKIRADWMTASVPWAIDGVILAEGCIRLLQLLDDTERDLTDKEQFISDLEEQLRKTEAELHELKEWRDEMFDTRSRYRHGTVL